MGSQKSNYVLESKREANRLDRQSRMKAYDFKDELQFLQIGEGQKVLDAGCGSGIVSDYLSKRAPGVQVVGIDYSQSRVDEARSKYGSSKNIHFEQKNLMELHPESLSEAFGGGRFDVIVCRYVLRHLNAEDGRRVVKGFFDALKPGGTLCCIDIEGIPADVFPASDFLRSSLRKMREAKEVNFEIARQLPALMMGQGFGDVDWHALISEFRGSELKQEIDNVEEAIESAAAFAARLFGGEGNFERFKQEYFTTLREQPGQVLYYNRVVSIGTKPKVKLKRIDG